jgi:glycerol-3-phosphate dehydrogenase
MATSYSAFERTSILSRLKSETYDLLIIGGGITGAGIALDASSRGLRTALVEKNDFAFGTSSRSTKLIHGGLRYLKQFEFGLVKEVGSERAIVHRLAPHLVIPEKMLLPLYERKGMGYWLTSIGLKIYDFLAGVKPSDQRRMLTRKQTLRYEPLLKSDDVKGGAIYAEYRTDDARLTIEIVKAAVEHGADILNYVHAKNFLYENDKVSGVQAHDLISNEAFPIHAKVIVNAAGPWVDDLRELNHSRTGKSLHLTKGVHIVLPHEKFPVRQAIYFDVEDGRMIFAIPRGRTTYVGTTDTTYTGSKDEVVTSREDAEYLLRGVKNTFSGIDLSIDDVESSWAGLRPLIHEDGKSASELSRKDEIFESPTGLISIAGGKLTGYRKMAERVVKLVIKRHYLSAGIRPTNTQRISLANSKFTSKRKIRSYINSVSDRLSGFDLPIRTPRYLVENYGQQTDIILKQFLGMDHRQAELSLLKAEAWFAIHHEMTVTLADFFVRRTGLLYFEIQKVLNFKELIAAYFQEIFKWDDEKMRGEISELNKLIKAATEFKGNA